MVFRVLSLVILIPSERRRFQPAMRAFLDGQGDV
jgi:hypothetical protein